MLAVLQRVAAMMDAEDLDAAPVLTTDTAVGSSDSSESDDSTGPPPTHATGDRHSAGTR
jgi:hypothetical protein